MIHCFNPKVWKTVESPQWLSEKCALWNSLGSSDIPSGLRPSGKSDEPREFPRANFSRQPLQTFHCLYQSEDGDSDHREARSLLLCKLTCVARHNRQSDRAVYTGANYNTGIDGYVPAWENAVTDCTVVTLKPGWFVCPHFGIIQLK